MGVCVAAWSKGLGPGVEGLDKRRGPETISLGAGWGPGIRS